VEYFPFGRGIFSFWSWNIFLLVVEYFPFGRGIFSFWSWNIFLPPRFFKKKVFELIKSSPVAIDKNACR
ncbi:MAG: hypothetical protein SOT81_04665, partial [Treponema sp.]|nr:hypothetical protein [Treponema sp.]